MRDNRDYPPISIPPEKVPTFTNGKEILAELETRVRNKRLVDEVISGPDDVTDFFSLVFPEVKRQHHVGETRTSDYKIWEKNENVITIEEDKEEMCEGEKKWDVYVGGPAAMCGAVIQARSEDGGNVLYAHDGIRGISNWKGSASSYILRDICPLYHGSSYNSLYVAYVTLRDALHRRVNFPGYLQTVKSDGLWVNVRIYYRTLLSDPGYWLLALKNQWNAVKDVGLYMRGTYLTSASNTTAYTSIIHGSLTPVILKELNLPYTVLYLSNERSMSLDAAPGRKKSKGRFINAKDRLEETVGSEMLEERVLSKEEARSRGYDPDKVFNLVERPIDGAFPMSVDQDMEEDIIRGGGKIRDRSRLVSVLVKPVRGGQDCKVTRVRWEDAVTGEMSTTAVNTLTTSLGPSATTLRVSSGESVGLFRRLVGGLQPGNLMQKIMLATASTMVFLIKIDKTQLPGEDMLKKFRDDLGVGNKHYLMLGEREVDIAGKPYHVFAIQGSGGGLFPCRHSHPEAPLNFINAVLNTTLQLDTPGVEFEILSLRTCSRGVTAQNFMRLAAPAANMTMVYGLGGLGMGTMVPNGLLLKAVMKQRGMLAEGVISEIEFRENLKKSKFDVIPHWGKKNPFSRDYFKFFDMRTSRSAARQLFGQRAGSDSSVFQARSSTFKSIFRLLRLRR